MPLSPAAPRAPLQHRRIQCDGYRRDDGLWDIEGQLLDTKDYVMTTPFRQTPAGNPIHEMLLRLTVDDGLVIHAVEVAMDSHPFPICGGVMPNFQRLVGEKIGRGFTERLHTLVGRTEGCTHMLWLIQSCATVALQTVASKLGWGMKGEQSTVLGAGDSSGRPPLLNSCHSYSDQRQIVQTIYPKFYKGTVQSTDAAIKQEQT